MNDKIKIIQAILNTLMNLAFDKTQKLYNWNKCLGLN